MSDPSPPPVLRACTVPVSRLVRPERNPNVMDPAEYRALVEAIRATGFLQPILCRGEPPPREPRADDPPDLIEHLLAADAVWRLRSEVPLPIIDGVHRLDAAEECGLAEVSVVVGEFDERTARLLQIGMNRMRGELDLGAVGKILDEMVRGGAEVSDLLLCGYPEAEIDALLESMRADPDDLADVGSVGSPPEDAPEPDRTWELTLTAPSRKALRSARTRLKKLGAGDLWAGLEKALADDED